MLLDSVHRSERLELIVTHQCNFRCHYCHVDFADGALSWEHARRAMEQFFALSRKPKLQIKIFGGEPTLESALVVQILRFAREHAPGRVGFELNTNGSLLTAELLDVIGERADVELHVSIDGTPERQREQRRIHLRTTAQDSYDAPLRLKEQLLALPNVVVNHTIAPRAAAGMFGDWAHLASLGFTRFHFLPAYYTLWTDEQVAQLRDGFARIGEELQRRWRDGVAFECTNFFVRARVALFWEGLVVDTDGAVFPSSSWVYRPFDKIRERLRIGHVDVDGLVQRTPPSREDENAWMRECAPPEIFHWTAEVDAALTEFVRAQMPHRLAFEAKRRIGRRAS